MMVAQEQEQKQFVMTSEVVQIFIFQRLFVKAKLQSSTLIVPNN